MNNILVIPILKYIIIVALITLFGCHASIDDMSVLKQQIDSLRIEVNALHHQLNARHNTSRIIKPKYLGAYVDNRWYKCDSVCEPSLPFNGKWYGMYSGYSLTKGDSGRLINDGNRFVVFPSDQRYYKGHREGY